MIGDHTVVWKKTDLETMLCLTPNQDEQLTQSCVSMNSAHSLHDSSHWADELFGTL